MEEPTPPDDAPLHIDQLRNVGNDIHEGDATEFMQSLFGFCNCGRPEDSLSHIRDVLDHVASLGGPEDRPEGWYDRWEGAGTRLFGSSNAEYFAYYVLTAMGLLEHGGSVPGWLTDTGAKVLSDLKRMNLDER